MVREIRLDQIGDFAEENYQKLIRAAVLVTEQKLKQGSPTGLPPGGGGLKNSWQFAENNGPGTTSVSKIVTGNSYLVFSDLPYTEPVITGNNLPPSWEKAKPKGWRSRNNQIKRNYHLTVAKDVKNWIKDNTL